MKMQKMDKILRAIRENPYVLILLFLGILLLLLPTGKNGSTAETAEKQTGDIVPPGFSVLEEQERLRQTLESISGVGKSRVLLSLRGTERRELAFSDGEAIIVSMGSGRQQAVESGYIYPEYLGAVVVCQGADNARVRLHVYDAVSAFTGLGADSIQVLKMD